VADGVEVVACGWAAAIAGQHKLAVAAAAAQAVEQHSGGC